MCKKLIKGLDRLFKRHDFYHTKDYWCYPGGGGRPEVWVIRKDGVIVVHVGNVLSREAVYECRTKGDINECLRDITRRFYGQTEI